MSDPLTQQSLDDAKGKEVLLDAFRSFLEADAGDAESSERSPDSADRQVDLCTLFSELAALKNEVKLEARQFKKALQQLEAVSEQGQSDQTAFVAALDRNHKIIAEQHNREALRPVLMQLLDLHDRMNAGLVVAGRFKPSLFRSRREMDFINAQKEGQALSLKRLQQILASCDVQPIETMGRILDPHRMKAEETESRKSVDDGVVTKELRKGFVWDEEVLRTAEVRVNKIQPKTE